jgi:hypothetical protein
VPQYPPAARRTFRPPLPLIGYPASPFIGELSYADLVNLLARQSRWFNRTEKIIAEALMDYLQFKVSSRPDRASNSKPVDR